ncbi:hypothetical protein [Actinomadura chokoriensis]|uniref:Uncharacterized protein n=1 Tax=Actinomadura chokoriensis TaxID=454156 RepID=A0ABV4R7R0_9ACTN
MSFGVHARKVRDPTRPYRWRVADLRSCVQLYRPLGFHATLSYLEEIAGSFRRDEEALLRALDALTASRELWKADGREYAAKRRRAKLRGQRRPRPTDPDPSRFPGHWYGAPQEAALHALKYWCRMRLPGLRTPSDQVAEDLNTCVVACLGSGGSLTAAQHQILADCKHALQQRLRPGIAQDDPMTYFRTRDLLTVASLLETASRSSASTPSGPASSTTGGASRLASGHGNVLHGRGRPARSATMSAVEGRPPSDE